jgi:hypothetical protein
MPSGAEISLFGPTLDVAIGLVLIYIVYALLLSTVVEAIASIAKLRARALESAVLRLIDGDHHPANAKTSITHRTVGLFRTPPRHGTGRPAGAARPAAAGNPAASPPPTLGEKVYGHGLISGLGGKSRPSYVSAELFASALLDVLREAGDGTLFTGAERAIAALPAGPPRQVLVTVVREAQGDWNHLRRGVEAWYNEAMDRLAGDYKRFIQTLTFILGLAMAAALNVDSIDLVQRLWVEKDLRAALVADAVRETTTSPPKVAVARGAAAIVQLPAEITTRRAQLLKIAPLPGPYAPPFTPEFWSMIAGWVLTAAAGVLGAPFWFELLQRLVNMRGSGPKPDVRRPPKT